MSRDVITVGSTMRIPLLYRGEYSEWRERFMNYLEEQTDEWKQYGTLMRQTKKLMDINIDALYNILKQNQGDVNDALGYKKKVVVITSDQLALVAEKTKEINANMVFMAKMEKVLLDLDESSSSTEETIAEKRIEKANQQTKDLENQNKDLQDKYDVLINQVNTFWEQNNEFNEQMKVLNKKNANLLAQMKDLQYQLKVKHVVIDTHTECQAQYAKLEEERYEYMIRYSALCDNDKQHRKKIDEQEILFDKMSRQLVKMNNNVLRLQEKILEKETKISQLEGCVSNKDVEIEKYLKRLNECENKLHKIRQTNQTIHMIMPSKDTLYNGRKGIGFENPSYFGKAKDLRPSLYDENVISLGYTPMFLIHSDEALEIEKLKEQERIKSSLHTIMGI
uniref:Uncharacterized protein n=1 Tax=Tanacetum cinerariifolium TaxID=118510 RepID=A0A6L2JIB3_TANCI|nr:hypothetical protein [Tanacetum cinerariifolium]